MRRRAPERLGTRSFRHGTRTIEFELVKSDRRTLGLTVGRDGAVVARSPRRAREADVVRWVAGHAEWISAANETPPRERGACRPEASSAASCTSTWGASTG